MLIAIAVYDRQDVINFDNCVELVKSKPISELPSGIERKVCPTPSLVPPVQKAISQLRVQIASASVGGNPFCRGYPKVRASKHVRLRIGPEWGVEISAPSNLACFAPDVLANVCPQSRTTLVRLKVHELQQLPKVYVL
ncbi:hypothetical protein [Qipengyuania flava]|uniref:hypothetical protein n=1 Tax=Qipengyuania flava TaxID=192812 RepID=UPI00141B86D0|nr:hypothetical protein [Qipengyuania flava]NIJ60661.1 hypothetical protein [Qipengyuania flava]